MGEIHMALKTKKRIAKVFQRIVYRKGFEHTTVSKVMKECEMRRQTFYDYFYDKFDLLEWSLNNILKENVDDNLDYLSWEEIIRLTFYEVDVNAKFYKDIDSSQQEVDLTEVIAMHFQILLIHLLEQKKLLQNKKAQSYVETNCIGIAGTIVHNLYSKHPREYDDLAEKVIQAVHFTFDNY